MNLRHQLDSNFYAGVRQSRNRRSVSGEAILSPDLRELARPIRKTDGSAVIGDACIPGAVGTVDAASDEPAARKLIMRRCIKPELALEVEGDTQWASSRPPR